MYLFEDNPYIGLGLLKSAAAKRSVAGVAKYKNKLRDAMRRLSEASPSLRRVPINNKATVGFDVIDNYANTNTDLAPLPKAELASILKEVQSGKKLTRQQLERVKKLLSGSIPPVDGGGGSGSAGFGGNDLNPKALLDTAKTKSSKWIKQLLAALGITGGGVTAWLASDDDSSETADQHQASVVSSTDDTDDADTIAASADAANDKDKDKDNVGSPTDTAPIHAPARKSKIFTGKNIGMTTGALATAIAANRMFNDRSTAERTLATLAGFISGGYGGRKLGEMFDS